MPVRGAVTPPHPSWSQAPSSLFASAASVRAAIASMAGALLAVACPASRVPALTHAGNLCTQSLTACRASDVMLVQLTASSVTFQAQPPACLPVPPPACS